MLFLCLLFLDYFKKSYFFFFYEKNIRKFLYSKKIKNLLNKKRFRKNLKRKKIFVFYAAFLLLIKSIILTMRYISGVLIFSTYLLIRSSNVVAFAPPFLEKETSRAIFYCHNAGICFQDTLDAFILAMMPSCWEFKADL